MLSFTSLAATSYAPAFVAPSLMPQSAVTRMGPAPEMFGAKPSAKPKPAATKKVPAKKAPAKKAPAKSAPAKKAPVKKAAVKKPVTKFVPNKRGFAYGLPGNFNALGGSELNFDPYGFLEGKSELEVNRYREAELTHGRVGMLAAVGFIVQEGFHPLFPGIEGPAIDQIPQLPFWLWATMGLGITFCEFQRISVGFLELDSTTLKAETALRPGYVAGQIGFDPLGIAPTDPTEFREMQEKELAHARLGMLAAAGFLAQEAVTKTTWGTAYGFPNL